MLVEVVVDLRDGGKEGEERREYIRLQAGDLG